MSNDFNNPFQSDSAGPQDAPPAGKGSNVWLWVLTTLGVLGLLGVLVCCGGGFLAFRAGQNLLADAFKQQLQGSQVIEEHIGTIESMSLNIGSTGESAGESGGSLVFDISGSKGSGQIRIKQAPGGDGTGIASAELVLPDGTKYPVDIGVPSDDIQFNDSFEIDLGEPAPTP